MTQDGERGRGILSPSDREFLRAPDEYTRQASYRRRDEIAERVWNAFLDGRLLFNKLDDKQRHRIFSGWEEFADRVESDADNNRPSNFYDPAESRGRWLEKYGGERGFAGLLAFLYLGLNESDEYDFEQQLERAVERAERSRGREVSTFSLDIEAQPQPPTEELLARFESRRELTTEQINQLREAGEIDDTDLIEYYDDLKPDTRETV